MFFTERTLSDLMYHGSNRKKYQFYPTKYQYYVLHPLGQNYLYHIVVWKNIAFKVKSKIKGQFVQKFYITSRKFVNFTDKGITTFTDAELTWANLVLPFVALSRFDVNAAVIKGTEIRRKQILRKK